MSDVKNRESIKICAVLPLTLDRVGPMSLPEEEEAEKITSVQDAFNRFRPKVDLKINIPGVDHDFRIQANLGSIVDFSSQRLQDYQPSETKESARLHRRNDLTYLRDNIRSLQHLRSIWEDQSVATAWASPPQRATLIAAMAQLDAGARDHRQEAEKISAVLSHFPSQPFLPYSPAAALGMLAPTFTVADTWPQTLAKLDKEIQRAERLRDELLRRVFHEIRPIERSWRLLNVFFENIADTEGSSEGAPELYVFNVDGPSLRPSSADLVEGFIRSRNDNFAFQDDISILVIPGFLPPLLRQRFEKLAGEYGLLLVSDLGDETSLKELGPALLPGGKYHFRLEEGRAPQHVVGGNYVQVRPSHYFEPAADEAGLFCPSSLVFSAIVARTGFHCDLKARSCPIKEIPAARGEVGISNVPDFGVNIPTVVAERESSGHLLFRPLGPGWDVPGGLLPGVRVHAMLRYVERCLKYYAFEIGVLTRDVTDEFEAKAERILGALSESGHIRRFNLFVDKNAQNRMQGLLDIDLEIVFPDGTEQEQNIAISVPLHTFTAAGRRS